MKKLLTILIFLLLTTSLYAQDYRVYSISKGEKAPFEGILLTVDSWLYLQEMFWDLYEALLKCQQDEIAGVYSFKLENFIDADSQKPIYNTGIAVTERVLVTRFDDEPYIDNGSTDSGIKFEFYYIDYNKGLKAYISSSPMDVYSGPLPPEVKEFADLVLKEVEKDGGVDKLYEKFARGE